MEAWIRGHAETGESSTIKEVYAAVAAHFGVELTKKKKKWIKSVMTKALNQVPRESANDLIAAYEHGDESRYDLLFDARHLRSGEHVYDSDDGLPYELVDRLFQDRHGADVIIPARVGVDLPLREYAKHIAITGNYTLCSLLVFDEEIVVLRANNDEDSPWPTDIFYCPRSGGFERHALEKCEEQELEEYEEQEVGSSIIPVVTPTHVSCFYTGTGWYIEKHAACMEAIEDTIKELGAGRLVAWSPWHDFDGYHGDEGEYEALAPFTKRRFDDDAAQAAFQEILLELYRQLEIEMGLGYDDLPPVGALRRERNRAVRGPHVRLRALVDQGRATCLRDGFLYEAAPAGVFRLVVSFL